MPLVKNYRYEDFPDWCELRRYEICSVHLGETKVIDTTWPRAAIFPLRGMTKIRTDTQEYTVSSDKTAPGEGVVLSTGKFIIETDVTPEFFIEEAQIFVCSGTWPEWAKIARFNLDRVDIPKNPGTPVNYSSNTSFDNHYHDYDEYWMPLNGHSVIQSEGVMYDVSPGDCICTRRGTHHHYVFANERIASIGFGSRLRENGSTGFLWEQVHGKPTED